MESTLEWEIEGDIMELYPEFAFIGGNYKQAIISDIHGRYVNNDPLWPSLRTFVQHYLKTVLSLQRRANWTIGETLANWGNLLSILNIG